MFKTILRAAMIGPSCPALTHNRRRTRPGAGEVFPPREEYIPHAGSDETFCSLRKDVAARARGARRPSGAEEGEVRRQATGAGEVFLPREGYNKDLCGELVTLDQLPSKVS